jgi:putative FmdB family regulatory protein
MTYDYECPGCGEIRTVERKMIDPEATYICTSCNRVLERKWSSPPISFKGSGFYSTDNKH